MQLADLPILKVHQAVSVCNRLLEPLHLKIEGELASVSINKSKYVFFDIKDEQEDVRMSCFMMAYQMPFPLEDGMRVVLQAKPGIYAKSGQFRLTIEKIEPIGEGTLKRGFELLKEKLLAEGMFDPARKRALPRYPHTIGIISSTEAAGYGDFIRILQDRLPVKLIVADVAVQGATAEKTITDAFRYFNEVIQPDVLVLVRGGGSIEDLHAFNSEAVARAILGSRAPVIVGVGHERDVTIADYVADVRAATPSNAAQLVLVRKDELLTLVDNRVVSIGLNLRGRIKQYAQRINFSITTLQQRLLTQIATTRTKLAGKLALIESLSPQSVLARGFSITTLATGERLTVENCKPGAEIAIQIQHGVVPASISN